MAFTNGKHVLYDSLRSQSAINSRSTSSLICLPLDIQRQITEYCGATEDVEITLGKVQQQDNGTDCGVFAVAFATHIVYGSDPECVVFDTKLMREHLIGCLHKKEMSVFPVLLNKRGKFCIPGHLSIKVYCTCNGIHDPKDPMVECSKCQKWFHARCVIANTHKRKKVLAPANKKDPWYCDGCK
jgi:hypothetical protein